MVGHSLQQLRVGGQVNETVLGIPATGAAGWGSRGEWVSGWAGCRVATAGGAAAATCGQHCSGNLHALL